MGNGIGRVTVVDRQELFVSVITHALEKHGYQCRGLVTAHLTTAAVVGAVARSRPDVVLASTSSARADGVDVLRSLRRDGHRVVALVERAEPRQLGEAYATGVASVATKSAPLEELLTTVGRTLCGEPTIESHCREELVRQYEAALGCYAARVARLTRQERDLLAYLMEGRPVAEVSQIRCVAEGTVRTQMKAVLSKLEVSSQLAAVAIGWRAGHSPSTLHTQE